MQQEPLTITKLLDLIKSKAHPETIKELCVNMKNKNELSKREFEILMTIFTR